MKYKLISLSIVALLSSCTTLSTDLSKAREHHKQLAQKIDDYSLKRVSDITEQKTAYSDAIACLGKHFVKYQQYKNFFGKERDRDDAYAPAIQQINTQIDEYKAVIRQNRQKFTELNLFVEHAQKDENLHKKPKLIKQISAKSVEAKELTEKIDQDLATIAKLEQEKQLYITRAKSPNPNGISSFEAYLFMQGTKSMMIAVDNIYDKTGKIYGDSTALSEMVANALTYNKGVRYVDTPFNQPLSYSRVAVAKDINTASIGSTLPFEKFISGALVQYDEGTPVTSQQSVESIKLSIDPLDINSRTTVINVGLTLRLINKDGVMYFTGYTNPSNDFIDYEPASIYVSNTFFSKQIGASLFEIKSKRNYGFNTSIITSDPKHYATRELVEKGVYELLLKTLPNKHLTRTQDRLQGITTNFRVDAKAECDQKIPTQQSATSNEVTL